MERIDPKRNGRCHAHTKSTGALCKYPAVPGATVCRHHGGGAPQVREKASAYLMGLAYPAAVKMGELINHRNGMIALAASKDVMDRVIGKAVQPVESDGRTIIEIEFVNRGRVVEHDA